MKLGIGKWLIPGEEVRGRWRASPGPAVAVLLVLYATAVLLVLGAGYLLIPLDSSYSHALPLIAFLGPLPFLAIAFALLEDFGWRTVLLLTDGRILMKRGLTGRVRALDRASIVSVTAYESSAVLHLGMAGGGTTRIAGLADPLSLVAALDRPGRIYRRPSMPKEEAWYGSLETIAFSVISGVGVFVMLVLMLEILHPVRGVWPLPAWLGISAALAIGIAFMLAAKLSVIAILPHYLAARRLEGAALRRFACWRLNRLCAGCEPYPETGRGLWVRLQQEADRWLIRRFHGGRLDCDCGPEIVTPGKNRKSSEL